MPIKPENKSKYPPRKEWAALRASILERAGHRCEFCGLPNHVWGIRLGDGSFQQFASKSEAGMAEGELVGKTTQPRTAVKIILTIAHLDHDPENNDPENLRALCQKCHNTHDAAHRKANASATRAEARRVRQIEHGQNTLEDVFNV